MLLGIETGLDRGLVDGKFTPTAFTFLTCEVALLLRLLDLIHSGWEGKVLYLAGRNSLFFFLALDRIIDVDICVDSELLQIPIELFDAVMHLRGRIVQLLGQLRLVYVHFSIFKVLLTSDVVSSDSLVDFPVLTAFLIPLFHKFLVLLELGTIFLAFTLLDRPDQCLFLICLSNS